LKGNQNHNIIQARVADHVFDVPNKGRSFVEELLLSLLQNVHYSRLHHTRHTFFYDMFVETSGARELPVNQSLKTSATTSKTLIPIKHFQY